jgi:hypothetical protein
VSIVAVLRHHPRPAQKQQCDATGSLAVESQRIPYSTKWAGYCKFAREHRRHPRQHQHRSDPLEERRFDATPRLCRSTQLIPYQMRIVVLGVDLIQAQTFNPVCFDAFAELLAQPDPSDLPRRTHVYRCEGDPDRRTTRLPGILMVWLQRRHLGVDLEERRRAI